MQKEIRYYITEDGKSPLIKWLDSIKDIQTLRRIRNRIDRLSSGLFGDTKSVGNGVNELRLDFGRGYRIYYSCTSEAIVLLLVGGDKSTQEKDIYIAKQYLADYKKWDIK